MPPDRWKGEPKIDYFATSLPNLLLFDDDLDKRNRIDSLLLSALASDGLGDAEKAIEQLQQVIAEDPNHLFAAEMLDWFEAEEPMALPEDLEVSSRIMIAPIPISEASIDRGGSFRSAYVWLAASAGALGRPAVWL